MKFNPFKSGYKLVIAFKASAKRRKPVIIIGQSGCSRFVKESGILGRVRLRTILLNNVLPEDIVGVPTFGGKFIKPDWVKDKYVIFEGIEKAPVAILRELYKLFKAEKYEAIQLDVKYLGSASSLFV
jgi:hypothetical protein